MGNSKKLVGFFLMLVVAAPPLLTAQESQPPSVETLDWPALYLDRASAQLDRLAEAFAEGDAAAIAPALEQYTREFSKFHVTMARFRIGKPERAFAERAVDVIESQISRLERMTEGVQSDRQTAALEAMGHLKSTRQMIEEKLEPHSRRPRLKVQGPTPRIPRATPSIEGSRP